MKELDLPLEINEGDPTFKTLIEVQLTNVDGNPSTRKSQPIPEKTLIKEDNHTKKNGAASNPSDDPASKNSRIAHIYCKQKTRR